MNILLARNFVAQAAIAAYTIVMHGGNDGTVLTANGGTARAIGVTTDIPAATNERCDVILSGTADVVYGGTVTRGDLLTADATGRAVVAAPAAGVNVRIVGVAQVSGVVGDVGEMLISLGSLQG